LFRISSPVQRYFGGRLVAQRKGGAVEYVHLDHLGSLTLSTSATSSAYTLGNREYFPFGIVSAALVATVVGAYALWAAAQMKTLAIRFEAGRVARDEVRQALLPNLALAALVSVAVLVAGVAMAWLAIGLSNGLGVLLIEKAHSGVWLMWTLPSVAIVAIAVAFAYVHRRVTPLDEGK